MAALAVGVLMLFDVGLAAAVFILLARPDMGVAFVLRRTGLADDWFQQHVSVEELARLRTASRIAGVGALALLFAASFGVGVVVATARLSG